MVSLKGRPMYVCDHTAAHFFIISDKNTQINGVSSLTNSLSNVNNLSNDMDDKCWLEKPSRF